MNKGRKIGLISVLVLIFAGFTAAQSTGFNIDSEDKTIWLNQGADDKTVNFQAVCGEDSEVKNGSVIVWDGVREYSVDRVNDTSHFRFNVSEKNTLGSPSVEVGSYQILGRCQDVNTSEETRIGPAEFEVDRLSVDIVNTTSTKKAYIGERFELGVAVSSELGNMNLDRISGEVPPSLFLGTEGDMEKIGTQQVISEQMTISSKNKLGERFIDAERTGVEVVYNDEYSASSDTPERDYKITLKDSMGVEVSRWHYSSEVSPSKRVSEKQLKDVNLTVKMRYEGEPVTPPGDDVSYAGHFYLDRSDSQTLGEYEWFSGGFVGTVEQSGKKYGKYELELEKRPEFDIGTEPLKVMFETDDTGSKNVADIIVRKQFNFEGRVSDSDSRAVQTAFKLQSDKYVEQFETNARGFFNRRVMPGSYGMNVDFSKGGLVLNDVELGRNYSGNINHQYYKNPGQVKGVELKGIDPINMMTVSFGYPFQSGRASMQYNPAKTEDPMNVDVYECQRWNFWGEDCISGWEKISEEDVTLPPTKWKAEFPVTPVKTSEYDSEKNVLYSAYVVGTNSGLALDRIGLEDYRVPSNEDFEVKGRAVTKGQAIEDANVKISLLDGSQVITSASTTTDSEGTFSLSIDAPEQGNYSLKAKISKGAYRPYSETLDNEVEVYKKRSMTLEMPDSIEVGPGGTVKKTLTVKNDGQTDFEEASLSVAESDLDISFSDKKFSVKAGQERDITVSVTVPEGFCDPSCVKYPTSDIMLEGDGFSEEFDLGVEIAKSGSKSASTSTESSSDTNNGGSSSPLPATPAGKFLASQSTLNIALGLITIFSLALASAVRKKKDSGGSDRDSRTINLQRPKVEPAEEPDSEVDEIAGNMTGSDDVDVIAQAMDEDDEAEEESEDEDIDALAEAMEEEEESGEPEEETEESDGSEGTGSAEADLSCDVCGEEFDTESGLKLHKQALH